MRRLTTCSIPAALALFVWTAHPQSSGQQNAKGSSTSSQQSSSATTTSQQGKVTEQERNQQSTFNPPPVSDADLSQTVNDVNKASTFMGMTVQNLQSEKLGTVKDLVFNPDSGKISYAVISVGGVLGVGDKLVAIPLKSLKPQPGEKYMVLNMTKDELKNAPGLAKNNWPALNDPALGSPAGTERNSGSGPSATSGSNSTSEISSDKPIDRKSSDQLSAPVSSSKDAQGSSSGNSSNSEPSISSGDKNSSSPSKDSSKNAQGSSPAAVKSSSDSGTEKNSGKDSDVKSASESESSSPKASQIRLNRLNSFPVRLRV
jgi:sporulation protein YlmC with PRC-barrel domain